ncbi:MAG: hypothetical protein MUF54_12440 [Polyangiaceae bacterium]|jgi:hypothetical protein|nr:hypothetical protein [Polyangiaceae bacterium]
MDLPHGIDGTGGSESDGTGLIAAGPARTSGMTGSTKAAAAIDPYTPADDCEEVGLDVPKHEVRGLDADTPWPEWFSVRVPAERVPGGLRRVCSGIAGMKATDPDPQIVASTADAILRAVAPVAEALVSRVTALVPTQNKPHVDAPASTKPAPSTGGLSDDAYIDQRSGLLDKQTFLRMARRGAFASKKEGKRVIARWGDVKAALQPTIERTKPDSDSDIDEADLDNIRKRVGLQVKQRG